MILTNTQAGPALRLWCADSSLARGQWESSALALLTSHGFQKVYTPHICKRVVYAPWDQQFEMLPQSFMHPKFFDANPDPDEVKKYDELRHSILFAHRSLLHFEIFRVAPFSYRELPQRYCEFGEHYRYGKDIENHAALWLTVLADPSCQNEEGQKFQEVIEKLNLPQVHRLEVLAPSAAELQFTDTDSKKRDCYVLSALLQYGG